ncbi:MAG: peptide antibiotic transporter SbmA [Pseudomonadota bacterium]
MFHSFFPSPRAFLISGTLWALLCVLAWYFVVADWAQLPPAEEGGPTETSELWLYSWLGLCYGAFAVFWLVMGRHRWAIWSVAGTTAIIFTTWFLVQLDVMINEWFGSFYDLLQQALGEPGSVPAEDYYAQLFTFLRIAMVYITVAVLADFFTSHYVFRWRTAMNEYYTSIWGKVRHIEGASQRIQEDTMKFAAIMESLGSRIVRAVMTLLAFLPILWGLSGQVTEIPILGAIPQPLVFVAVCWSIFGTGLLALVGVKLPGLEFRNQRVEAAYRKELVLGEDNAGRAAPPTLSELFANVRQNYFRLYFNYLYFNVARYCYLQFGVLVPYIALGPTIIAGAVSLGFIQQVVRAYGRVEDSFQFLVNSWTTIVELMSIHKRLAAFEAAIEGRTLSDIEFEVTGGGPAPDLQPAQSPEAS